MLKSARRWISLAAAALVGTAGGACSEDAAAPAPVPPDLPAAVERADPGEPAAEKPALPRFQAHETGKLKAQEGKEVIVTGRVAKSAVSSSGMHFLNFAGADFRAVCPAESAKAFPEGGPAALYKGKPVEIRGELQLYNGTPQIQIRAPSQVSVLDGSGSGGGEAFALTEVSPGVWVSPAGLRYAGRDPDGLTRKEHVLRHAKNQPDRRGSHGVFDGGEAMAFQIIDEAWKKAQKSGIRPKSEGDSLAYTIPMGRRVGYLGGTAGRARGNPALTTVFIVLKKGTKDVITAFPR